MKYVSLFFAQGDDAQIWLDDLDNYGAEGAMLQLLYHAPEPHEEPEPVTDAPWGSSDTWAARLHNGRVYVVAYNFGAEYVSLTRVNDLHVERYNVDGQGEHVRIHARPWHGDRTFRGVWVGHALTRYIQDCVRK